MTEPSTFVTWVRFAERDHYLLWASADADLLILRDGTVVAFDTEAAARAAAAAMGIELSDEEPSALDLDAAGEWVRGERTFDPNLLLDVWNLADDVLRSKGEPELIVTERDRLLYLKLFRSADIPVLEPYRPGPRPVWSSSQLARLRDYISRGVAAITKDLRAC